MVKARGEFVWHSHPDTDDFFLVLAGRLTIPKAHEEAHVLLIEPMGTPNTGDAGGDMTATEERI